MSREIPLTQGKAAIVDDDMYEELSKKRWWYHAMGHAYRHEGDWRRPTAVMMHRVVINAPADKDVDHINGNRLDNRRCNLRPCTQTQNSQNRGKGHGNTSGYKGVHWAKKEGKWRVRMTINGKSKSFGFYNTPEEAAIRYNELAIKYFGEFAKLNDVPDVKVVGNGHSVLLKNNTSGYRGVTFHKKSGWWLAYIGLHKKKIFLGCFRTPKDAGLAYNEAAEKYHGASARLNPIN